MRSVEHLDGLAISGAAAVGPLHFSTPALADSGTPSSESLPLRLRYAPTSEWGTRSLTLTVDSCEISLQIPIPSTEVSGIPGFAGPIGAGTEFVHWPLTSDDWQELRTRRPELVVLGNARILLGTGEPFVRALRDLREHLGAAPLIWAPRVGLPNRLALLAYLGIDVVDSTEALLRATDGTFLDPTFGSVDPDRGPSQCRCDGCQAGSLLDHARWALVGELRRVDAAIASGRLRELVEARLPSEPLLAELLRYADRHLAGLLDARTPVVSNSTRNYVLRESHRRPEVVRFRSRLLERYRPPPSKRVLVVVPCSKTKPYRSSPSQRRILRALEGVPNLERAHFVSVTSPLGVVPRELEDIFPARHYDIPVTGEWEEDERTAAVRALSHIAGTGSYDRIVLHLDRPEYDFLETAIPPTISAQWTSPPEGSSTRESLGVLRAEVDHALHDAARVPGGPLATVREGLREVAAFQFGRVPAEELFRPPVRLRGRPWAQRLTDGENHDLASWREERGLFHLTVPGGRRLLSTGVNQVEIDAGLTLTGDLFTPGVRFADASIRTGDAVLVVRSGDVAGVGEATLPGPLMTELGRGLAVRIRHRAHVTENAENRQGLDTVPRAD